MSVSLVRVAMGEVGVKPGSVKMISTDSLATITTAGYLNKQGNVLKSVQLAPNDVIECLYAYNNTTNTGTLGVFQPNFSAGIITLNIWENPGDVLLPVVSGDFPIFNGTAGQIKDSGLAPSSTTSQLYVVTSPGSLTSGNIPFLNDTHGTLNTGRAPSATTSGYKVVMSPGSLTSGNFPALADVNGTLAAGLPPSASGQAYVAVSPGSLTSGNLLQTSDTHGTLADAGITASGLQVLSASVTLNLAAIQAMYATPFQIVAAVANKVIVPVQATLYTNFQTAAHTGGGVAILQYDNTTHGGGTNALTATIPSAEITAAASQIYSLGGVVASALTGITNKGLYLSNQTGAFTGGNAASTLVMTVSYYLVTASV